jgi:hypothetical protein
VKLRGRRAVRAAAASGLATLLLTGCGELTPGTASQVDETRITDSEVHDLAEAQCAAADRAAAAGQSTTMPVSRVQQQSLGLLIDTELSLQFAQDEDIEWERSVADGFFNQLEPGITPLPEKTRTVLTDVFRDWSKGRAILVEAGSQATDEEVTFTNVDQLIAAGLQERDAWQQDVDVRTDPRYSPNEQGFPGGGDGSVSRARSGFAKDARAAQPDPEWVSGLPDTQKCG